MKDCKVYLVWCPTHEMPKRIHPSFDVASREARRLAHTRPGAEFYVMAALAVATVRDPISFEEFILTRDMPF